VFGTIFSDIFIILGFYAALSNFRRLVMALRTGQIVIKAEEV